MKTEQESKKNIEDFKKFNDLKIETKERALVMKPFILKSSLKKYLQKLYPEVIIRKIIVIKRENWIIKKFEFTFSQKLTLVK
jgi:hypothetical protein